MPLQKQVSTETKEEVVQMSIAGATVRDIAKELNISTPAVYRILHDAGKRPAATEEKEEEIETFLKAYFERTDEPVSVVLREYNKSYSQLYSYLTIRHLEPRKTTMAKDEEAAARELMYDKAVEMYLKGEPGWKISSETGVANPMLYNILHRRGIALRSHSYGKS